MVVFSEIYLGNILPISRNFANVWETYYQNTGSIPYIINNNITKT